MRVVLKISSHNASTCSSSGKSGNTFAAHCFPANATTVQLTLFDCVVFLDSSMLFQLLIDKWLHDHCQLSANASGSEETTLILLAPFSIQSSA